MKRILLIMILFVSVLLTAESNAEVKSRIGLIKSQPKTYYFGYAEGKQRKETDQEALESLMSSIYIVVSSEIKSSSVNESDTLRKVLQTYTHGRLPDVLMLSYKVGPIFHILRFIEKSNYQKIFKSKRTEVEGFLREAEENLATNQFGKVFRNYYRAAISLEALPENNILYHGKTYRPKIIFNLIRDIAKDIKIKVETNEYKDETRYIVLNFSYKNKPVQDLNLFYYDNHGYIPQKTNTNLVELQLYGKEYEKMNNLTLKIDLKEDLYSCYSDETDALSKLFKHEKLEDYREIPLKKEIRIPKPKNGKSGNVTFENSADCPVLNEFTQNVNKLFMMLNNEYLDDESIFTDASIIKRMNQVISCNHTKLLSYPQTARINKTNTGWEARQLGVSVSCEGFPSRNETVVIDFDNTGKIYNFCYTINPALHNLFQEEGIAAGNWSYRQIAIKFLENYKTSYNTKNIEDIETLYSEDAIIITGKVAKRTKPPEVIQTDFSDDEIIYFKRTKQEHITHQREIFKKNRFVWLQFDTFNIQSAPLDKVYGVTMKQNYYSSTYKDEGYLFLLIDFRGDLPLIHVRNWQPGEWDLAKQMKLENFRFY